MILPYLVNFEHRAQKTLKKMKKKDKKLYAIVSERLEQIEADPKRFKPLKAPLSNRWRVHVDSFVILYMIDEASHKVFIIDICHHDDAY